MNYSRVMLAAVKSGSGKTTITCGVLAALQNNGLKPCSFKCGPDYIDPMFHRKVLGIPAGNLDTYFTDEDTTRELFVSEFTGDMAVIEGVMGLYDGVGGIDLQGSSYDLARVLKTPIVLVIDAKGAGRSVLAEIRGFLDYDNEGLIKGVILNRTPETFGTRLGKLIEKELEIKCLGVVPEKQDIALSSRHLGLVLPDEIHDIKDKLSKEAQLVANGIDLKKLMEIAYAADELDLSEMKTQSNQSGKGLRLAVARDEAFCFYYRENLEMLKRLGVEIVEFSPIHDEHLPEDISGIILGGGYPEEYLPKLQANSSIKADIRRAIDHCMPLLAECGGFMYLLDNIKDQDGKVYTMVGAINGEAQWTGKLSRFGYILIDMGDFSIKGHEFHYYDTDNNGSSFVAQKPGAKRSWPCIHKIGGSYIGFPHLYYPSAPEFVEKFVEAMKNYGGN